MRKHDQRPLTSSAVRTIETRRLGGSASAITTGDEVVAEEPLEIRIDGDTFAVTMRTPGHDRELVLGLLLAEGVIGSTADVLGLAHCGKLGSEARENTIDVKLVPGVKAPVDPETGLLTRRGTLMTSACGVCGRRSVADLLERITTLAPQSGCVRSSVLSNAVRCLGARQPVFARTGGCHAAAIVDWRGRVLVTREDIGRHNAVDKAVGERALGNALPCSEQLLVVSGRSSFEIVQKAFSAGVPIVASVSAASSLAVELAGRAGITLVGFVREDTMTVYTHAERIAL